MNIKKKIILVFFFLAALAIGVFLSLKQEKQPSLSPLPEPAIPNPVGGGFQIEAKINEKDFKFPNSLSVLVNEPPSPFTEAEAKEAAKNAGFAEEPTVSYDIYQGKTYIWSSPKDFFIVYSKTRKIVVGLNWPPPIVNKRLGNDELIGVALAFLEDKALAAKNEVSFSFFTFLKKPEDVPEGFRVGSKEEASTYLVNFSPIKSEFKVVTLDPWASPISVWVTPDGTVTKTEITNLKTLSFSPEKYSLKNYQDFKESLPKAVPISLDDGNLSVIDLPKGNLQKIRVEQVELAYLADSLTATKFQPIFLLTGKAQVTDTPDEVNILLYLPAIKNP